MTRGEIPMQAQSITKTASTEEKTTAEGPESPGRRDFLKLLGSVVVGGIAGGGLSKLLSPRKESRPSIVVPEGRIPETTPKGTVEEFGGQLYKSPDVGAKSVFSYGLSYNLEPRDTGVVIEGEKIFDFAKIMIGGFLAAKMQYQQGSYLFALDIPPSQSGVSIQNPPKPSVEGDFLSIRKNGDTRGTIHGLRIWIKFLGGRGIREADLSTIVEYVNESDMKTFPYPFKDLGVGPEPFAQYVHTGDPIEQATIIVGYNDAILNSMRKVKSEDYIRRAIETANHNKGQLSRLLSNPRQWVLGGKDNFFYATRVRFVILDK